MEHYILEKIAGGLRAATLDDRWGLDGKIELDHSAVVGLRAAQDVGDTRKLMPPGYAGQIAMFYLLSKAVVTNAVRITCRDADDAADVPFNSDGNDTIQFPAFARPYWAVFVAPDTPDGLRWALVSYSGALS